eukprot:2194354-Prymnesium_polylepis.1
MHRTTGLVDSHSCYYMLHPHLHVERVEHPEDDGHDAGGALDVGDERHDRAAVGEREVGHLREGERGGGGATVRAGAGCGARQGRLGEWPSRGRRRVGA